MSEGALWLFMRLSAVRDQSCQRPNPSSRNVACREPRSCSITKLLQKVPGHPEAAM